MFKKTPSPRKIPSYGFDAPPWIIGLLLSGSVLIFISLLLYQLLSSILWVLLLTLVVGCGGFVLLFLGILMLIYGLFGKYRMRQYMLDRVSWKGDEKILDIGTGLGLLAIGAAKRAPRGKVVAIDLWISRDLSGNSKKRAIENATIEGVDGRVEFETIDASKLPYPDESFDVVLSLLCLHNIQNLQARTNACREISRVLKPRGICLIADYIPCTEYETELKRSGLVVSQNGPKFEVAWSLMWLVDAEKSLKKIKL